MTDGAHEDWSVEAASDLDLGTVKLVVAEIRGMIRTAAAFTSVRGPDPFAVLDELMRRRAVELLIEGAQEAELWVAEWRKMRTRRELGRMIDLGVVDDVQ